ncbi:hypothetical protein GCM10009837_38030 [Streptomyces durmitorensis]
MVRKYISVVSISPDMGAPQISLVRPALPSILTHTTDNRIAPGENPVQAALTGCSGRIDRALVQTAT